MKKSTDAISFRWKINYSLKRRILIALRKWSVIDQFFSQLRKLIGWKDTQLASNISDDRFEFAKRYFESYREHSAIPAPDSLVFEFGAGGELFMTLCEAAFGFKRIVSTDIAHWLNPVFIEKAAEYVKSKTGFPNGNVKWHSEECEKILSETFNIDYFVADARHTSFPDNHVDFVFANAVLEHIPKAVLKDILRECFRISKPGSLLAFEIDYRDHGFRSGGYSPYVFCGTQKNTGTKIRRADSTGCGTATMGFCFVNRDLTLLKSPWCPPSIQNLIHCKGIEICIIRRNP